MGFWYTNRSPNLSQTTRPYNNLQKKKKKKKKRTCKIVDFAVPTDHRVKLKENEMKDKYLDLARELKNLWNMKVMVMPIVIGALGWDRPEHWEESWRLEETCYHSNFRERPSANADMKNFQGVNNNNNPL